MTGKDVFGALVRAIGLWLLIVAIRHLSAGAYYWWKVGLSADVVGEYLLGATPDFLIGLFLLARASSIARFGYRNEAVAPDTTVP